MKRRKRAHTIAMAAVGRGQLEELRKPPKARTGPDEVEKSRKGPCDHRRTAPRSGDRPRSAVKGRDRR